MARYGMVLNLDRCIGCYNCQIACKDEHVGNEFPGVNKSQPTFGHFWIGIREVERELSPSRIRVHYIPTLCQQCREAPCIAAGKNGAAYRRKDGIVIIDPEKAVGQKQLVDSCPYGAIFWNEETQLAQKCSFCAHLLDSGWAEPRCVQTCPAGCMNFGDFDDPKSTVSRLLEEMKPEPRRPDLKSAPGVYYSGLPKPYLSGRVLLADRNEWAEGVSVTLTGRSGRKREAATDWFGEFAFDALDEKSYSLRLAAPGYSALTKDLALAGDLTHLGDLVLRK
jgi:Fe-S-cluster-containing dehydrogenase component